MINIAARITDLKSSGEMDALREQAAAGAVADQIDACAYAFSHRGAGMHIRHQQDSTALFHLLGSLGQHVRQGGDPAILNLIETSLEFAVGRE